MVDVLKRTAVERGCAERVVATVDNGETLQTVTSASCDVYVSNFGLVFFDSPEAGLKQAMRVLRTGGRVALSTWSEYTPAFTIISQYVQQVKELRTNQHLQTDPAVAESTSNSCIPGSSVTLKGEAGCGDTPRARSDSETAQNLATQAFKRFRNAETLPALVTEYGFENVSVHPVSHQLIKPTPEAYWRRMSTASPGTIHTLGELSSAERSWVKRATIQDLTKRFGDGEVSLEAKAYIVLANKP